MAEQTHFHEVEPSPYLPAVYRLFDRIIKPVYGDQTEAMEKIATAKDRKCEVLLSHTSEVLGVLVFKLRASDEYAKFGVRRSLEIKTLSLADPDKHGGKGYGSTLLSRAIKYAKDHRISSIHLTVSQSRKDALEFFKRKGFMEKYSLTDSELLLCKILPDEIRFENAKSEAPVISSPTKRRHDEDAAHTGEDAQRKRKREEEPSTSWQMPLKQDYIDMIRDGRKTIEGRINSGLPAKFRKGDRIKFHNSKDGVTATITKIEHFTDMFTATDVKECLPKHNSIDAAVKLFRDILPDCERRERASGVLAIHLTVQ